MKKLILFLSALLIFLSLSSPVLARDNDHSGFMRGRMGFHFFASPKPTPDSASPSPYGAIRSCQTKKESVKNRMTHLMQLANNMEKKFDSIASRVEKYYTDKVLPSGKTLSNYDSLLSDINTKKDAVKTALDKAT